MYRRNSAYYHPRMGSLTAVRCARRSRGAFSSIPPQTYLFVSAVFHYLGPAFAVMLFADVSVLGVVWLRIAGAAAVFAVWRRPWRTIAAASRDGRRLFIA